MVTFNLLPDRYSKRQSNIELLRIIAMCGIIVMHIPLASENFKFSSENIFFSFINASESEIFLSLTNVFVLISAYFGIRPTWKGALNLLFIKYFWEFGITGFAMVCLHEPVNIRYLIDTLNPLGGNWFISAYLGMYFMTLFFNKFIENANRQTCRNVTATYIGLILIFGWLSPFNTPVFQLNHSALYFGGLYMLGRYIAKYSVFEKVTTPKLIVALMLTLAANGQLFVIAIFFVNHDVAATYLTGLYFKYCNPFTMLAAILILQISLRYTFKSKLVNRLAVSAFSLLIIHLNSYIKPIYSSMLERVCDIFPSWMSLFVTIVYIGVSYVAFSLIDQIRIIIWEFLVSKFAKKRPL